MPNQLIATFRQQKPEEAAKLSDDEITLHYLSSYGEDVVRRYPDASADLDRIFKQATIENLTPVDYVKNAVSRGVRGAVDAAVASPLEAIGTAAAGLDNWSGTGTSKPEDALTYKLAQGIRKAADYVTPEPIAALDDSMAATKIPSGLGSALGFMAGGGVAGAGLKGSLKAAGVAAAETLAPKLAVAGLGAASGAMEQYKDAINKGADFDTAFKAYLLGGAVGTSEVLPISHWLERMDKFAGGGLKKFLINTGKETLEEGLQEAFQSGMGDVIAAKILKYDPDREMLGGMMEDAKAGGAVGAIFSMLTQAIGHYRSRSGMSPDVTSNESKGSGTSLSKSPSTDGEKSAVANVAADGYGLDIPFIEGLAEAAVAGGDVKEDLAKLDRDAMRIYNRAFITKAKARTEKAAAKPPAEADPELAARADELEAALVAKSSGAAPSTAAPGEPIVPVSSTDNVATTTPSSGNPAAAPPGDGSALAGPAPTLEENGSRQETGTPQPPAADQQTITGSNAEKATEMPVQPEAPAEAGTPAATSPPAAEPEQEPINLLAAVSQARVLAEANGINVESIVTAPDPETGQERTTTTTEKLSGTKASRAVLLQYGAHEQLLSVVACMEKALKA